MDTTPLKIAVWYFDCEEDASERGWYWADDNQRPEVQHGPFDARFDAVTDAANKTKEKTT